MKIYKPLKLKLTDEQYERIKQFARDCNKEYIDLLSFAEHEANLGHSTTILDNWYQEHGDLIFHIGEFD
jgi:hypothetical protein